MLSYLSIWFIIVCLILVLSWIWLIKQRILWWAQFIRRQFTHNPSTVPHRILLKMKPSRSNSKHTQWNTIQFDTLFFLHTQCKCITKLNSSATLISERWCSSSRIVTRGNWSAQRQCVQIYNSILKSQLYKTPAARKVISDASRNKWQSAECWTAWIMPKHARWHYIHPSKLSETKFDQAKHHSSMR